MEGGKEQNFWPGFVDALSNVVLVMIFVVVVFVVTLFYYSQKLAAFKANKFLEKKGQQEQVVTPPKSQPDLSRLDSGNNPDSADVTRVTQENQQQTKEIADLKSQVARLQQQLVAANTAIDGNRRSDEAAPSKVIQIDRKTQASPDAPGIRIDSAKDAVALRFDRDGVELTADATKTLDRNIKPWIDRIQSRQGKLVITGVVGTVSYTEGRRRAYYRAVAVRNYLIEQGVAPNSIVSRVVPGTESAESDSTVLIQYRAAKK